MRAVKYDLCYNGIIVQTTNDYAEAVEWKDQDSKNSYQVRLEEVLPEVSEKEKAWREYFIAKKNAFRARKLASQF